MDVCKGSLKSIDKLIALEDAHLSEGAKEEMRECWGLGKEIVKLEDYIA